jgi:hypothetical protein
MGRGEKFDFLPEMHHRVLEQAINCSELLKTKNGSNSIA